MDSEIEKIENTDGIIDPDETIEALYEVQGKEVTEEVTILTLLVKNSQGDPVRVKVRYLPQSIGTSLQFDDGIPITPGTRKPKFNYKKWARETLPKLNGLALKNVQIVDDLQNSTVDLGKRDIRLSHIANGEFRRLHDLCFPGSIDGAPDSENEDNAPRGAGVKGLRGAKSANVSS